MDRILTLPALYHRLNYGDLHSLACVSTTILDSVSELRGSCDYWRVWLHVNTFSINTATLNAKCCDFLAGMAVTHSRGLQRLSLVDTSEKLSTTIEHITLHLSSKTRPILEALVVCTLRRNRNDLTKLFISHSSWRWMPLRSKKGDDCIRELLEKRDVDLYLYCRNHTSHPLKHHIVINTVACYGLHKLFSFYVAVDDELRNFNQLPSILKKMKVEDADDLTPFILTVPHTNPPENANYTRSDLVVQLVSRCGEDDKLHYIEKWELHHSVESIRRILQYMWLTNQQVQYLFSLIPFDKVDRGELRRSIAPLSSLAAREVLHLLCEQ